MTNTKIPFGCSLPEWVFVSFQYNNEIEYKDNQKQVIMAVAKGNREYKYQKTFVKVFHSRIENIEKEINDWIKNNEDKCEIVDIEFTSDCQTNAVMMAVCHHIPLSME